MLIRGQLLVKEEKMRRIIIILLVFSVSTVIADTGAKVGLSFLKIGVDARAAAMGDAYSSCAHDAAAAYWNPAGLAGAVANSVVLMHNAWLQDINQEFAAIQFLNGDHNLAVSINMLNVSGIELRDETASEEPVGTTDVINTYLGLAYATTIMKDWQVGIQLKYLYEKYYFESADGFALDLGIKRQNILAGLNWALVIQNLGKMSVLRNESTPLPLLFRSGFNYKLPFQLFDYQPLLAADLVYVADDITTFNLGFETRIVNHVDLRAGYILGRDSQHFRGGFGIVFGAFDVAYAFVPFDYDLGSAHLLSLAIDF
jgi:hypothetical protein